MIHLIHRSRVDRYFAGDLGAAAIRTMFEDLWRCGACRMRYERHLLLERTLAAASAPGADRLWQSIVATSEAAPEHARKDTDGHPARRRALLALSLAVAAVLLVPPLFKEPTTSTPVPRGAPGAVMTPSLHLYRTHQGRSEPVRGELHSHDGVLLAYSNPSANLGYLMVFGVDGRGGVHWYYPAYDRQGEDPAAVQIRTKAFGVELGEEIRHRLPEGDMRMFALFLRRPHRVLETEASIAAALAAHGGSVRDLESLPLVDGDQTSVLLEVQP
jgi:hypothetical protein